MDKAQADAQREQDEAKAKKAELDAKAKGFHEQLRAFRERDKALNDALALSGFQRMWNVVLPQAMRIGLPPIGLVGEAWGLGRRVIAGDVADAGLRFRADAL